MAVKISIRPNGPYLVEGEVELVDVDGNKLDTSGRGPRFASAAPFFEGLAMVQVSSGKVGFVDKSGKDAIQAVFDALDTRDATRARLSVRQGRFSGGLAHVRKDGKVG